VLAGDGFKQTVHVGFAAATMAGMALMHVRLQVRCTCACTCGRGARAGLRAGCANLYRTPMRERAARMATLAYNLPSPLLSLATWHALAILGRRRVRVISLLSQSILFGPGLQLA
jgi:hypothetical protein